MGLSRLRKLSNLIVEPFKFERLTSITKNTSEYRMKEECKLQLIPNRTMMSKNRMY